MKKLVRKALIKAEDTSGIVKIKRAQGGSINESFYIETVNNNYFLKYHHHAPQLFFSTEVEGLQQIRETNTIRVPDVLALSDEEDESFLLLEWIDGEKKNDTEQLLGEDLAKLHQTVGPAHGFYNDTFIGILTQPNKMSSSWLSYYRDHRLNPQLQLGLKNNRIKLRRHRQIETLLEQLDKWIPSEISPSYLHGDLWGGNWIVGEHGKPYLIDPSFLYGDRHFDLAFSELFGGFSDIFYHAYNKQYSVESYYADIKPLYQLYYLLVHLNIFGETYGVHVDTVLNYYVGK